MKNNNSKNSLLIPIVIILVITLSITYQIFGKNQYRKDYSTTKKRVLVEKYYVNYAKDTNIREVVIFNDGNIYFWNKGKQEITSNLNTEEGLRNLLIKKGEKSTIKVKKYDLKKLENYIKNLKNKIVLRHISSNKGTAAIAIWNGTRKIDIKVVGDNNGENKTKESQAILKITDKYLNKYLKSKFKK